MHGLIWILALVAVAWNAAAGAERDRAKGGGDRVRPVVALDIGHTPKVHGATSARGGKEYDFNRRIALLVEARLREEGMIEPVLINRAGAEIELMDRVKAGIDAGADAFVSIHHDAVQEKYLATWEYEGAWRSYSDVFRGYSVFVSKKNEAFKKSRALALALAEAMKGAGFERTLHHNEPIPGENRPLLNRELGVYQFDDLVVLKYNPLPAALLECGVIVHREEESDLLKPEVQARIAEAIVRGLNAYCAEQLR